MVGQLVETVDPQNFIPDVLLGKDKEAEQLVWALQVLEVTGPHVHVSLRDDLMDKSLLRLCVLLSHPYRAVRHLASRCLAVFARMDSVKVMELVVSKVGINYIVLVVFYVFYLVNKNTGHNKTQNTSDEEVTARIKINGVAVSQISSSNLKQFSYKPNIFFYMQ